MARIYLLLAVFALALASQGATLSEINKARTYGELEALLQGENSPTSLPIAIRNVMVSRHPFNYDESYMKAVAEHFAAITNYNAGPSPSLLFQSMEYLGVVFGPKKMFELPPQELVEELENLPEWRETYPPLWARLLFNIDSLPLPKNRHCDIVRAGKEPSDKIILLMHGGGMILPMSPQHWTLSDYLAKATSRDVFIPDYPMLPHITMSEITDCCFDTYKKILQYYDPKDVVMMGDSAGCSICLTVCFRCLREKVGLPSRLILVSPAHFHTYEANIKEEIEILSKEDEIIPPCLLDTLRDILPMGKDVTHNEFDPFHGQVGTFPPMDIFTGTREIFAPQAVRFYELAKRRGAKATLTIGKNCIHDWILIPWAKESVETRDQIADIINKD